MDTPVNSHADYHAHFYFDESSLIHAKALRTSINAELGLYVGNFNTKPVGPHPQWSFQASFTADDFEVFVPWCIEHRQGISVLLHAVTGDDLRDHTEYVQWLGAPITLDLSRI